MNKIIIPIVLFIVAGLPLSGQQESQYTQFMYNQQLLNPAYAGSRGVPSFMAIYRNQWLGYEGSPVSQLLTFSSPILGDQVGIGGGISHHKIGIMESWYFTMAYSYHLKLSENSSLRLGIQGSLRNLTLDFNEALVIHNDDPSILDGVSAQETKANVGVGVYYNYRDIFYIGGSIPYIYPSEIGFNNIVDITAIDRPHFYFMTGALLPLNGNLDIKPSVLVKYVNKAPFDMDINLSLVLKKELMAGVSYRLGGSSSSPGESLDLTLFYQLTKQFGLGAAYDYTLSDIRKYSSGTFEILLRYDVFNEKEDMDNPRYF
ncbi:MAG: type IX secretion system membrane protein PorP/SprF [Bacteroidetes bacterium]|nr:type IX secretion system membrane protein PorP/SprF [Bacteroidota bacterium]